MNKVILMGRLTRDPESRYTQANSSQESMCVARYTLAVDRRGSSQQEQSSPYPTDANGFMNIPDGIDEELPFN